MDRDKVFVIRSVGSRDSYRRISKQLAGIKVDSVEPQTRDYEIGEGKYTPCSVRVLNPQSWMKDHFTWSPEGSCYILFLEVELVPDKRIWITILPE
jgi:hypothetical protein